LPPRFINRLPAESLSPRQVDIIWLLSRGFTALQIAEHMSISVHTVKTHLKIAFKKLGAKSSAHAVALAHENCYIKLDRKTNNIVLTRHGDKAIA
jgi:DNA-binding CsgD family transcriptional regulator